MRTTFLFSAFLIASTPSFAMKNDEYAKFLQSQCNTVLTGEVIKVSPNQFMDYLGQQIQELKDPTESNLNFAIQRLSWYQIETQPETIIPTMDIMFKYSDLLSALDGIVLHKPRWRLAILNAVESFIRLNIRYESMLRTLGGPTLDFVGQWANDYRLPDEFRAQAAYAYNRINGGKTIIDPSTLVSSEELKAKNTVEFLGRTQLDLTLVELGYVNSVNYILPSGTNAEKLELFKILMAKEQIPPNILLKAVDDSNLHDEMKVHSLLNIMGFKQRRGEKGEELFYFRQTDSILAILNGAKIGTRAKKLSKFQKLKIKELIRNAIQKNEAYLEFDLNQS